MNSKLATFLMALSTTTLHAQESTQEKKVKHVLPDLNVETRDGVRFNQHFAETDKTYKKSSEGDFCSNEFWAHGWKASFAGEFIVLGVGLGIASNIFDSRATAFKKEAAAFTESQKLTGKRLLAQARRNERMSGLTGWGSFYFIIDGITGFAIAMSDHRPIFAANIPVLAAYLARKGTQGTLNLAGELPVQAEQEWERVKAGLLGDQYQERSRHDD